MGFNSGFKGLINDGGFLGLATPEKITSLAIISTAGTSAERF